MAEERMTMIRKDDLEALLGAADEWSSRPGGGADEAADEGRQRVREAIDRNRAVQRIFGG